MAEVKKDKEKALVDANRDLAVIKQDYEAAKQEVIGMKAKADGEAERRTKVILADGALNKKKEAYEEVIGHWAVAVEKLDLVPTITISDGKTAQAPPAYDLLKKIDEQLRAELGLQWTFPTK